GGAGAGTSEECGRYGGRLSRTKPCRRCGISGSGTVRHINRPLQKDHFRRAIRNDDIEYRAVCGDPRIAGIDKEGERPMCHREPATRGSFAGCSPAAASQMEETRSKASRFSGREWYQLVNSGLCSSRRGPRSLANQSAASRLARSRVVTKGQTTTSATVQKTIELRYRLAHLLLDAFHANAHPIGDLGIAEAVDPVSNEYLPR